MWFFPFGYINNDVGLFLRLKKDLSIQKGRRFGRAFSGGFSNEENNHSLLSGFGNITDGAGPAIRNPGALGLRQDQ